MPTTRRQGVAEEILDKQKTDYRNDDPLIDLRSVEIDGTCGAEKKPQIIADDKQAKRGNCQAIEQYRAAPCPLLGHHQHRGHELQPYPAASPLQSMGKSGHPPGLD